MLTTLTRNRNRTVQKHVLIGLRVKSSATVRAFDLAPILRESDGN